jgi:transcription antitermination factor NusG
VDASSRDSKGGSTVTMRWYALQSKPMKESFLSAQLSLRRIECYYPCIRVQPVNTRARRMKPYFPGYVFGRLDLEQISSSAFQWIPGAVGIVSFDRIPSHVPDNLVNAIRRHVDEINAAGSEHLAGLKPGVTVVIQGGPLDGYEAIFDTRVAGEERVRVFLKLLRREQQKAINLPSGQIRRK